MRHTDSRIIVLSFKVSPETSRVLPLVPQVALNLCKETASKDFCILRFILRPLVALETAGPLCSLLRLLHGEDLLELLKRRC